MTARLRRKPQVAAGDSLETEGVRIQVKRVFYLPDKSEPAAELWTWAYEIEITNLRPDAITLRGRNWRITSDDRTTQPVESHYVDGGQPRLEPNSLPFRYLSGVPLPSPSGSMSGWFVIEAADGTRFDAHIPAFDLNANHSDTIVAGDDPRFRKPVAEDSVRLTAALERFIGDVAAGRAAKLDTREIGLSPAGLWAAERHILETGYDLFNPEKTGILNFRGVFRSKTHEYLQVIDIAFDDRYISGDIFTDASVGIIILRDQPLRVAGGFERPMPVSPAPIDYEAAEREVARRRGISVEQMRAALDAVAPAVAAMARLKWGKDNGPDENPAAFAWRAYQAEAKAGALHMGVIRQEDDDLAVKLVSWLRSPANRKLVPEGFDIPTKPEWNTRQEEAAKAQPSRLYNVLAARRWRARHRAQADT